MTGISDNNKKIAKNTLFLYMRMFLMMAVSLYTSRVILQTLGIEDFGIYNVVAGIVVLFAFVNGAMSIASQRFISFALGRNDKKEVENVFNMSVTSHISIALLVLILGETIGLWLLHKMNFPLQRSLAIEWTYQIAILTCCLNIIRVPYNASIISYEKMSFYAWISILEAFLKLFIVYLVQVYDGDKLISYSFLLMFVTLIVDVTYVLFCVKKFTTCRYSFYWDKKLLKKFLGFTSWSVLGSLASMASQQGLNMILNVFCGVFVNAAVGVANQVMAAFTSFMNNFQTAFNPQLVKSYAKGDKQYFLSLIVRSSKFSYFLLLLISLPVIVNCDFFLNVWLDEVPEYSIEFSQLMIVFILLESLSGPLWISVQATGQIKKYQLFISLINFINIPSALLLLYFGFSPVYVYMSRVCINVILLLFRAFYLKKIISFPIEIFVKKVLIVVLIVTMFSLPIPILLKSICPYSWGYVFLNLFISVLVTALFIYLLGLDKNEKYQIKRILFEKVFSKFKIQ